MPEVPSQPAAGSSQGSSSFFTTLHACRLCVLCMLQGHDKQRSRFKPTDGILHARMPCVLCMSYRDQDQQRCAGDGVYQRAGLLN